MAESYYDLLRRPEWLARRDEIIEAANFECVECGARDVPFHVHHRYYLRKRKPWEYPDDALMCVCEACHTELGYLDDELRLTIGALDSLQLERVRAFMRRMIVERFGLDALEDLDARVSAQWGAMAKPSNQLTRR